MTEDSSNTTHRESDQPKQRRRSPLRAFIWTAVGGTGFGLLAVLVVTAMRTGDRMPEVDDEALAAASERWDRSAPASYDLELRVSGSRDQQVSVEVRDGDVADLSLDGNTPSQRRTWDYWSVPGLLDIIEADLARAEDAPPGSVRLFAEFDATYGYPRRYRRIESNAMANAEWNVVRFAPVGD
ncbi:MAG: hypothetical protein KDA63_04990 [Planctomycetales bacterium]|nr:hypothetical protein [Planctomycetales bacterium]